MGKKKGIKMLSAEKASAKLSDLLASGEFACAPDAVKAHPELELGLAAFQGNEPRAVSQGSGPALLRRPGQL